MKICSNKNLRLRSAIILAMFFVLAQTATAQQLKPKEIVYSRLPTDLLSPPNGANSPTIWAVGQDGANDRQITTGMEPRISDDGRFLLFRRFTTTAQNFPPYYNPYANQPVGQLWVRDLANNSETMIFDFTSNGRRLFGYSFTPFSNQGNYQIIFDYGTLFYKMNLDGTNATAIDPYSGGGVPRENDTFPVLRRDDSLLAADSRDGGIVTRTLGSEVPVNVPNTSQNDYNPSWSNDNQFVGFTTLRANGCLNYDSSTNCNYPYFFNKVGKIKPDGSNRLPLTDLSAVNTNGIAFGTIWTENNSKIIVAARINSVAGLYAVNADGSGVFTKIPISNGNAPDFVGGIVQPRTDALLISNGGGFVTDQNGNFSNPNDDGNFSAETVASRFSMESSIAEPIAGDAMSGGSFTIKSGFIPNTPPNIAGGTGGEGDVAPRPNGDGSSQSNDVVEVQRFQIGLDQPFQSNEFQRADNAPFVSKGDGAIQANDVIQTQRYQIGLEQSQTAAGPVDFGSSFTSQTAEKAEKAEKAGNIISSPTATRQVRVESTSVMAGQPVTVNIRVDAVGDEAAYGFTLNYNAAVLTATSVQIGTAGGSRLCNLTIAGQIRCSIISFPDNLPGSDTDQIGEIGAGDNQLLVKINFNVPANARNGASSLNLASADASNDLATNLPITTQSGTVTVSGGSAARVSVGGRILTASGKSISRAAVILTKPNGETQRVVSSGFGYYKFQSLTAGETYVISVTSKRYSFEPQAISLTEDLSDINFIASN